MPIGQLDTSSAWHAEIEIDNKVDKAGARLDEISARKGVSVRILLLASLLNTTIVDGLGSRKVKNLAARSILERGARIELLRASGGDLVKSPGGGDDQDPVWIFRSDVPRKVQGTVVHGQVEGNVVRAVGDEDVVRIVAVENVEPIVGAHVEASDAGIVVPAHGVQLGVAQIN